MVDATTEPRTDTVADGASRPTVLHVTEALGAGVGLSLARLVRLQTAAGARCVVLATRRYDTPDDAELRRWFGDEAELHVHAPTTSSSRAQLPWLGLQVIRHLHSERFTALHLHSSFAGLVGRLVAPVMRMSSRTFYSPHGFAFLRSDLPAHRRMLVLWMERVLARLGSRMVLVSEGELEVAHREVRRGGHLLPNGVDLAACRPARRDGGRTRPRVAMVGRIAYQKAPWRFAEAARRLSGSADFVWLGYGEPADVERWISHHPVSVTGPLRHADLLEHLGDIDVLYFPTLWEGMPLSLIEAQACGVPAVASDVVGNRDVVIDGETGLLGATEDDLIRALERLIAEPELRHRLARGAAESASRFSDDRRGIDSLALYAGQRRG